VSNVLAIPAGQQLNPMLFVSLNQGNAFARILWKAFHAIRVKTPFGGSEIISNMGVTIATATRLAPPPMCVTRMLGNAFATNIIPVQIVTSA
jgi:hypothetical protein